MYDRLLGRLKHAVVGAAVFPAPPGAGLHAMLRRTVALDGPAAPHRLAFRWAANRLGCLMDRKPWRLTPLRAFEHHGITVDYFSSPNDPACHKRLRQLDVDVVYNNQPRFLEPETLSIPRLACLNRHASLLPAYRGLEPVLRALLAGDRTIGATIHVMTPDYDSGPILAQASIAATPCVFDCYRRIFALSDGLFLSALETLSQNPVADISSPKHSSCFGPLTPEEIRLFKSSGLRYL